MGGLICRAAKSFFNSGFLLKELNQTFIALVPKVDAPSDISQFRPISLCNFLYKVFSKCLANRLKPLLNQIISPLQSAFVPNRMIQNSILVAHEAFHHLKMKKANGGKNLAFKIDLNKAYDRLEWDFLIAIMRRMGFCQRWCDLIWQCIITVSNKIMFNSEPLQPLLPKRGLRQGDPISPYLFMISQEALSINLSFGISERKLEGLQIKRNCPILSHLFSADDSIFFSSIKEEFISFSNLNATLNEYCSLSGQHISFLKSSLFFSVNVSSEERINVCNWLGVKEMEKSS